MISINDQTSILLCIDDRKSAVISNVPNNQSQQWEKKIPGLIICQLIKQHLMQHTLVFNNLEVLMKKKKLGYNNWI